MTKGKRHPERSEGSLSYRHVERERNISLSMDSSSLSLLRMTGKEELLRMTEKETLLNMTKGKRHPERSEGSLSYRHVERKRNIS